MYLIDHWNTYSMPSAGNFGYQYCKAFRRKLSTICSPNKWKFISVKLSIDLLPRFANSWLWLNANVVWSLIAKPETSNRFLSLVSNVSSYFLPASVRCLTICFKNDASVIACRSDSIFIFSPNRCVHAYNSAS
jgi:hypothetical protein